MPRHVSRRRRSTLELVLSFHCGFQGSTSDYQALTHKWIVGEENIEEGRVHSARAGPTGYQGMGRQGLRFLERVSSRAEGKASP